MNEADSAGVAVLIVIPRPRQKNDRLGKENPHSKFRYFKYFRRHATPRKPKTKTRKKTECPGIDMFVEFSK